MCRNIKKKFYFQIATNLLTWLQAQWGTDIWCSFRGFIVDFENQMYIEQSQVAYQKQNDYPMKTYSSNFTLKSRHAIIQEEERKIHNTYVKNIKKNGGKNERFGD